MIPICLSLLPLLLQVGNEIDPEAGEFNVFLFCLVVVVLTAFCLLIAIGIVVGLVAAAAMAGACFLAILANGIISGLVCRSPNVGVTVLTLQFGGLVGLVAGIASCVAVRWILEYGAFEWSPLLTSGAVGLALGAGAAWIGLRLIVAFFRQIKEYGDSRLRKPLKFGEPLTSTASAGSSLPPADELEGGTVDD